ncbi:MAG: hypothetical protein Ct9H300mP29_3830 [Candidatus Neomarinimicrobiota bacterium]|nr:MAG: hypothetical protein Ct9H300mP29_3830 [Candidatus Neomarinimicrobiota bacterium]
MGKFYQHCNLGRKNIFTIEVEAHAEGRKTELRLACFATVVWYRLKKIEGNYQKVPHGKFLKPP